jgi:hypothetical protein
MNPIIGDEGKNLSMSFILQQTTLLTAVSLANSEVHRDHGGAHLWPRQERWKPSHSA